MLHFSSGNWKAEIRHVFADTFLTGERLEHSLQYCIVFVFNFFRDAILISYTAGLHEGRLFSYLQVYKNEEKTN